MLILVGEEEDDRGIVKELRRLFVLLSGIRFVSKLFIRLRLVIR